QEVTCNDNADGKSTSSVVLPTGFNTTIYIQISSFLPGGGLLHLEASLLPEPPDNDQFAAAIIIPDLNPNVVPDTANLPPEANLTDGVFTHADSSVRATTGLSDPNPSCAPVVGESVWYLYEPSRDAALLIDTAGSDFDTV